MAHSSERQQATQIQLPPTSSAGSARHTAAWLRGCCYLSSGNSRQALRDACAAMAYAPQAATPAPANAAASPLSASRPLSSAEGSQEPCHCANSCTWFPALLLAGEAYLGLQHAAQAVLHLAQVCRLWSAGVRPAPVAPHNGFHKKAQSLRSLLQLELAWPLYPCCRRTACLLQEAFVLQGQTLAMGQHAWCATTTLCCEWVSQASVITIPTQQVLACFSALCCAGLCWAVPGLLQAERLSPPYAAPYVSSVLRQAVQRLTADQTYAWATGGTRGLQQQLADEADMRLPEVLRPRPKW